MRDNAGMKALLLLTVVGSMALGSRLTENMAMAAQDPRPPGECAPTLARDGERASMRAGTWNAECVKDGGCAVFSLPTRGARLQLARRLDERGWRVVLSLPRPADAGQGVEIAIDARAPERVPPEFLEGMAGGRALAVRPEVAGEVMRMLRDARARVAWRHVERSGAPATTEFSLACLRPVLDFAERELARLRALRQMGK